MDFRRPRDEYLFGLAGKLARPLRGSIAAPLAGTRSGPGYDADAQAYFTAAGITAEPYLAGINQFVLDLKAASIWTKFDRLYILANESETAALTCLVSLNQDAESISGTAFAAGQGYTGDGVADYIDTNYNPATQGVNYTLNEASLGVYVRAQSAGATTTVIGASAAGTGGTSIRAWWTDNKTYSSLNTGDGGAGPNATLVSRLGLLSVVRTASNANVLYQGATSRATSAQAATSVVNTKLAIFAINATDPSQFSAAQLSMAYAGGSLSAQNMTDFSAAVDALKVAIGF